MRTFICCLIPSVGLCNLCVSVQVKMFCTTLWALQGTVFVLMWPRWSRTTSPQIGRSRGSLISLLRFVMLTFKQKTNHAPNVWLVSAVQSIFYVFYQLDSFDTNVLNFTVSCGDCGSYNESELVALTGLLSSRILLCSALQTQKNTFLESLTSPTKSKAVHKWEYELCNIWTYIMWLWRYVPRLCSC